MNPDNFLFRIYAVRTGQSGDHFTHAWNMSMGSAIEKADVFLHFQELDEPHPALKIEVQKQPSTPLVFYFYKWNGSHWYLLKGQSVWDRFHDLEMQPHALKFDSTDLLDSELGLEHKKLVIRFVMTLITVNGEDVPLPEQKIEFVASDGTHYVFGDESAHRRPKPPPEEQTPAPEPAVTREPSAGASEPIKNEERQEDQGKRTISAGTIVAIVVIAILLLAGVVIGLLYLWRRSAQLNAS